MALTTYNIRNSDGSSGGTQTCEGSACYPQLLSGQTRVAGGTQGAPMAPVAPVTTIDAGGKLVHPNA